MNVERAAELLREGVESILTSEGMRSWIALQGRLSTYSWRNTLLIQTQRDGVTMVAGFKKWQSMGRVVRKGERGIMIWSPRMSKRTRDDGSTYMACTGFGTTFVFDISQTDVIPGKEESATQFPDLSVLEPVMLDDLYEGHGTLPSLRLTLADFCLTRGVNVREAACHGPNGWWSPSEREIVIEQSNSMAQQTKTLVHEVAHMICDDLSSNRDSETIAEVAAFIVLASVGIDSGQYSFPYVAGWAGDMDVLSRNLATAQKVAAEIIRDAGLAGIAAEKGMVTHA
jgi:antirestriction protein ArdC